MRRMHRIIFSFSSSSSAGGFYTQAYRREASSAMSFAYNSSYQSIQKLIWLKNTASINYMSSILLYFIGSKNILARFPHVDGFKMHK